MLVPDNHNTKFEHPNYLKLQNTFNHLDYTFDPKRMASYSMEEFVGNGVLRMMLTKLVEEGWDDVPTLKIMNAEEMDAINMTHQQKVWLSIKPLFLYSFTRIVQKDYFSSFSKTHHDFYS